MTGPPCPECGAEHDQAGAGDPVTGPTQGVRNALRQLAAVDDDTLGRLTAGGPLTRARLRQALVTGALSPADFDQALRHAQAPRQPTNTALDQGGNRETVTTQPKPGQ